MNLKKKRTHSSDRVRLSGGMPGDGTAIHGGATIVILSRESPLPASRAIAGAAIARPASAAANHIRLARLT